MSKPLPAPEFSRLVRVDALPNNGETHHIQARESERAQLALRFGLPAISNLEAHITLQPSRNKGTVRVTGQVTGQAIQACIRTLEPVDAHVQEDFSLLFVPAENSASSDTEDIVFTPGDEDAPESYENNQIDIGELTAQYFFLALDPYPLSPRENR